LYGFTVAGTTATWLSNYLTYQPGGNGGTSGIAVDNVSTQPQASSIYFATVVETACTSPASYCAVKLTQSALQ
jgi:hypothetical protein